MPPQRTPTICITFIQFWPNVLDVGPTLYECFTKVLCLLGHASILWRLDYYRSLYASFIIHLRASESSVSRINYHYYINLLVVRVSHG